jgi:hypothetical protein
MDKQNYVFDHMKQHPILANNHKFWEMTPEEMRLNSLQRAHKLWELNKEKYFTEFDPMQ